MTLPPNSKIAKRALEGEADGSGRYLKKNRTESLYSISENGCSAEQAEIIASIDTRWPSSISTPNLLQQHVHDPPPCLLPGPHVNIRSISQPGLHGISPTDPVPAIVRPPGALIEDTLMTDPQAYFATFGNEPLTKEVNDTGGDLMRLDNAANALNTNDQVDFFGFSKFDQQPAEYLLPSVMDGDYLQRTLNAIDSRDTVTSMTFEPQFSWCNPVTSHFAAPIPAATPDTMSLSAPSHEEHDVSVSALESINQPNGISEASTEESAVIIDTDYVDIPSDHNVDALKVSDSLDNHNKPRRDQYDTCFGVIIADVISSFEGSQGSAYIPVNAHRFGDMIKLSFQDSKKYAGIITLPILGEILQEFNVKFAATLVTFVSQLGKSRSKKSMRNSQKPQSRSARIVVHGTQCEKSAVGNMLSDAGIYLQQPTAAECDRSMAYANPHYLIRPGSQMPDLEGFSSSTDDRSIPVPEKLNELEKGRLMRIFDFANADNLRPHITPSRRLSSCLKEWVPRRLLLVID
ncbi:MAG: hypothetical protein Q9165_000825 [Trypethelium subeluteriae]